MSVKVSGVNSRTSALILEMKINETTNIVNIVFIFRRGLLIANAAIEFLESIFNLQISQEVRYEHNVEPVCLGFLSDGLKNDLNIL